MEKATYKIRWCDILPEVGTTCDCGGRIQQGKFNSVYCYTCKTAWRQNKRQKLNGTQMIMEEITALNKRMDEMAKYLERRFDDLEKKFDKDVVSFKKNIG